MITTSSGARMRIASRIGAQVAASVIRAYQLSSHRAGFAVTYHGLSSEVRDPKLEVLPTHGSALFANQVEYLSEHFRPVRASDLLGAVSARRRGEPFPVAITFDDDLTSHVEIAAPILREAGIPATFFLCGASLDRPHLFWWERLQRALDRGKGQAVSEIVHRHASGDVSGGREAAPTELGMIVGSLPPDVREDVSRDLGGLLGPDPEKAGIRAGQVEALASAGFKIGFHTAHHLELPTLSDDALRDELTTGRDALERIVGSRLTTIAYPHGRADSRIANAAREAGFTLGFTTRWTAVTAETDPLLVGRVDASFESVGQFALRLMRALIRPLG